MSNDERRWFRRLFQTAHRKLLHQEVDVTLSELQGDVLVIGAGYGQYRGTLKSARSVMLTDIDGSIDQIDRVMDAHELTLESGSFDAIVAIEVFEHLRRPAQAAAELHRVLRPGGRVLISIPFMFRVHGDPHDFQRLTRSGIEDLFREFSIITVKGFGRRRHVISDLITTRSRLLVPLRIFNHVLASRTLKGVASGDSPSGYVVKLVK